VALLHGNQVRKEGGRTRHHAPSRRCRGKRHQRAALVRCGFRR
jgi:hypothetical protein